MTTTSPPAATECLRQTVARAIDEGTLTGDMPEYRELLRRDRERAQVDLGLASRPPARSTRSRHTEPERRGGMGHHWGLYMRYWRAAEATGEQGWEG